MLTDYDIMWLEETLASTNLSFRQQADISRIINEVRSMKAKLEAKQW